MTVNTKVKRITAAPFDFVVVECVCFDAPDAFSATVVNMVGKAVASDGLVIELQVALSEAIL